MRVLKKLRWRNLSISWKYGTALILTLILFSSSALIVSGLLYQANSDLETLGKRGERVVHLTEMASLFTRMDVRIADYITLEEERIVTEFEELSQQFDKLDEVIRPRMDTERLEYLYNGLLVNKEEVEQLFLAEIVPAVNDGLDQEYLEQRLDTIQIRRGSVEYIDEIIELVNIARLQALEEAQSNLHNILVALIITILISILVGLVTIYFVSKKVKQGLDEVVEVSNEVANGNLVVEDISYDNNDELGRLATAINMMSNNLRDIVQSISQSAQETSATSQQLSASSEEATGSIEEITATAEEFSASINDVSDNSDNVNLIAENVEQLARNGLEQMEKTDQKMKEILITSEKSGQVIEQLNQSSQEIGEIVEVISSIAEETNLLALNAAIEAARAGEEGHGFAVVADEVRELAEQTQSSVSNIRNIIDRLGEKTEKSVDVIRENNLQIESGADALEETGRTFKEIVSDIGEVVNQIGEIASAQQQLSVGSEEISNATEEQSASMQQISSSSQQLANMAEELNSLVEQFKI
ncbi:methyl-accepting chemotaxis protein [Natroniella sp. ANB-PHB2]|uniref:methyl-accepting chemotaxis protein n=1 Tax=Natroniella sp. ANB-PHB2 TaxID=3384444 RepID=UPI0038D44592